MPEGPGERVAGAWRTTRSSCARGYSVTEVMTILTALALLSGASAPAVHDYLDRAKLARAEHDVRTIAVSLVRLFDHVQPERHVRGGWATYDLMVGAGAIPRPGEAGTRPWTLPAGGGTVGWLDDHLVRNGPGYSVHAGRGSFGWRGAYLQREVGADPWGHRYAVNVRAMRGSSSDTFVLSAGPDAAVSLPFAADGLPPAGDDIVAIAATAGMGGPGGVGP
jgi:hypothetical protein